MVVGPDTFCGNVKNQDGFVLELNLMPKSSLSRQQFKHKQPYLAATTVCLLLVLLSFGFFQGRQAADKRAHLEQLQRQLNPLTVVILLRVAGSGASLRCERCREHVLEYNTTAMINLPSFEADHGEVP